MPHVSQNTLNLSNVILLSFYNRYVIKVTLWWKDVHVHDYSNQPNNTIDFQTIAQLKGNISRLETQIKSMKEDLEKARSPSPRRKMDRRSGWAQTDFSPDKVGRYEQMYRIGIITFLFVHILHVFPKMKLRILKINCRSIIIFISLPVQCFDSASSYFAFYQLLCIYI